MRNKSKTFLGLGLAAALAIPAVAVAWPGGGAKREQMIEKFDTNKDGTLDDAERDAMRQQFHEMREQHRAEILAQYDTDKDGQLSDAERAQLRNDRITERFKALDTNGDNVLSFEEFSAGAEQMGHHRGFRHGRRGGFMK